MTKFGQNLLGSEVGLEDGLESEYWMEVDFLYMFCSGVLQRNDGLY